MIKQAIKNEVENEINLYSQYQIVLKTKIKLCNKLIRKLKNTKAQKQIKKYNELILAKLNLIENYEKINLEITKRLKIIKQINNE